MPRCGGYPGESTFYYEGLCYVHVPRCAIRALAEGTNEQPFCNVGGKIINESLMVFLVPSLLVWLHDPPVVP